MIIVLGNYVTAIYKVILTDIVIHKEFEICMYVCMTGPMYDNVCTYVLNNLSKVSCFHSLNVPMRRKFLEI